MEKLREWLNNEIVMYELKHKIKSIWKKNDFSVAMNILFGDEK